MFIKIVSLYILVIFPFCSISTHAQLNFSVNSLADDDFAYAYDDPNTDTDESMDGICRDEMGRCTMRAAVEEALNMSQPIILTFGTSGTINLIDEIFIPDNSIIDGGMKIELKGVILLTIEDNTTVKGLKFSEAVYGLQVEGDNNNIGTNSLILDEQNEFINCVYGIIIYGNNNSIGGNYIGIDRNLFPGPNHIGLAVIGGNNNLIGGEFIGQTNNICLSSVTGVEINDGMGNLIANNNFGFYPGNVLKLGNSVGITISGADNNIIGSDNPQFANVIGNSTVSAMIINGVPPDSYSSSNIIKGNIIGLNLDQSAIMPNNAGITLTNGVKNIHIKNNIISGNTTDGISIFGYDAETLTEGHIIEDNNIGINSEAITFSNGGNGIHIYGNVKNLIIGTDEIDNYLPNRIVGNSGSGIKLSSQFDHNPDNIVFRKNLIYQNIESNIFLDPQTNHAIQPPFSLSNSGNTIAGIHDIPNAIIDIYKSNITELKTSAFEWIGSTTTGSNGIFSFDLIDPTIEAIAVTATSTTGETSGFAELDLITDINDENDLTPKDYYLAQNFPNPFNPTTTINYSIPVASHVTLKVLMYLERNLEKL